jgi:hypothetical protein
MVTSAKAALLGSSADEAVTVTAGGLGALAGAVYRPSADIVPQVTPMQPVPKTFQIIFLSAGAGAFNEAANCRVVPTTISTNEG